jgi:ABC-type lipoprotein export system ATPase subunit
LIKLRGVGKTYELAGGQVVDALRDVDLHVERREFLVITGRSGAGKTTLLNVAAGLTRPSAGEALLDGVDLWAISDKERSLLRNRAVGLVFQFPSLLPILPVLDNVLLPLALSGGDLAGGRRRAVELLDLVGLADKAASYPRQLSAGQQQRAVIARALMNEPSLLLADEPSSDLDEETEQEIMHLFAGIHREAGITIVMVTHARQLVTFGTRHAHMSAGALQEQQRDEPTGRL